MIIFGDVGTGKTLMATMMAMNDDTTRALYANYKINLPRFKQLEPQMLNEINTPSLVIIDEAYAWLESRMSGADINRYMSYILFQSRKRKIDFVLTTQLLSTLDLRFKGLTEVYMMAEKTNYGFQYTAISGKGGARRKFHLPQIVAERYYPCYDTFEKIDPMDDGLILKVTPDKRVIVPKLDEIIEQMTQIAPLGKWTMPMVKAFCIENGLKVTSYADMLHGRLKLNAYREAAQNAD